MEDISRKKKATLYTVLVALLVIVGFTLTLLYVSRASIVGETTVIYVPEGTTYEALLDTLTRDERVTNINRFRQVASVTGLKESVREGRYQLKKGMNARELARMLRSGNQKPLNVTFNNIRTMPQFAGRLGAQLKHDSLTFLNYLASDSVANAYGFSREEFIGMFLPNTYQFYWTVSPTGFLDRMKREYDTFWNDERTAKLERTGLTRKEVAVLASIIDEETNMGDEMATMAGVYMNRLRIGMPLQADPTVKFAVGDPAIKRVLRKHTEVDSPYNTYKHKGLPPAPIRMPSIRATDAVLNYSQHEYLYFCAKPDFSGYHAFARTLAEHNRNAQAYARALDNAGIR